MISPTKTSASDRKTHDNKLNYTLAVGKKFSDNGFSFLNSYRSNKISNRSKQSTNIDPNSSLICEPVSVKRNLNESFNVALKSHKSSDNFFRKKKRSQEDDIVLKIKDVIDVLEYKSSKLKEIIDLDIDRQKQSFEEKKCSVNDHNDHTREKKKKYLKRKGSLFEKVIKTMAGENKNHEIVKKIFEFAENKIIDEQNTMHKEIEEYLIQNIGEMENEIKLLRESYDDDLSKFDDEVVYKDIISRLRDESSNEINKVTVLYESIRAIEIEKIKTKYLK
jgi:dGTP triphosphohydrolase